MICQFNTRLLAYLSPLQVLADQSGYLIKDLQRIAPSDIIEEIKKRLRADNVREQHAIGNVVVDRICCCQASHVTLCHVHEGCDGSDAAAQHACGPCTCCLCGKGVQSSGNLPDGISIQSSQLMTEKQSHCIQLNLPQLALIV
jgi:hypothetical protein